MRGGRARRSCVDHRQTSPPRSPLGGWKGRCQVIIHPLQCLDRALLPLILRSCMRVGVETGWLGQVQGIATVRGRGSGHA
jgi:hypothetical protein